MSKAVPELALWVESPLYVAVIVCVPTANELTRAAQPVVGPAPPVLVVQGLNVNVAGAPLVRVIVPVGVFGCDDVSVTTAVHSVDCAGATGVVPQLTMVEVECGITPQPIVIVPTEMN